MVRGWLTQINISANVNEVVEMAESIERYAALVRDDNGVNYTVEAVGETTATGLWQAWLEFHPDQVGAKVLRTGRETTQPNRRALEYWATGLEPIYLEGAFTRALARNV